MTNSYSNLKQASSNFLKLLQERIEKANPRRKLSAEETKRVNKLEAIADNLKRGENVQNRQLKTWLSEEEYEQLEYEWREQLELPEELKDKPSDLKRYEDKLKQATFNYNRADWFAAIDKEWTALKECYETYLADDNFDIAQKPKRSLSELTKPILYKLDNNELG